jgi:hypothetical protein
MELQRTVNNSHTLLWYTVIFQDEGWHDHAITIMLVAWGQFIDHDITLTAETKVTQNLYSFCPGQRVSLT